MTHITRRECLHGISAGLLTAASGGPLTSALRAAQAEQVRPRNVAAVATVYFKNSHADVLLGKILDGWEQQGGDGPALNLTSVYIEQFPEGEIGREMCRKQGVKICDTISEALTLGEDRLAVEGVISIGEHGDYPYNEIGQHLFPRRRFLEEIAATFEKCEQVVPVFSDKHLGPAWDDAHWMYERTRELQIPFMAGSSLPVGYRLREVDLPLNSPLKSAVGIGYSGLDVYGIHALEFYQSHVERRAGGEQGVRSVQFLTGPEMWRTVDEGVVSRSALEAAFAIVPKRGTPDMRKDDEAGLFLFEYIDGFVGAVFMFRCVHGTAIGMEVQGKNRPLATAFDERSTPRHPHFAYLLKAIEGMIHTGRPAYPVERTLLTSGILDRGLNSRAAQGERIETPELQISYTPVDYPHAPHVDLLAAPGAIRRKS